MWVRKTDIEIDSLKVRKAKSTGYFYSISFTTILMVVQKTGYSTFSGTFDPISWVEFSGRLPIYAIFAVIIFMIVFKKNRKKSLNSAKFCVNCEKVFRSDETEICSCGGKIGLIGEYRFVENDEH